MKRAAPAVAGVFTLLALLGAPFGEQPRTGHHYGSPEPILPMTFAHRDHVAVQCVLCHHNYVDDTGTESCMGCHVSSTETWPLLEEQFHGLCRDCHVEKAALGEASGPTRHCLGCHLDDPLP